MSFYIDGYLIYDAESTVSYFIILLLLFIYTTLHILGGTDIVKFLHLICILKIGKVSVEF